MLSCRQDIKEILLLQTRDCGDGGAAEGEGAGVADTAGQAGEPTEDQGAAAGRPAGQDDGHQGHCELAFPGQFTPRH